MLQLNVDLLTRDVMNNKPMVMLLTMMAGWINRQQQEALEYLKEENKILRDEIVQQETFFSLHFSFSYMIIY
jgi:hypothetical protein